MGYVKTAQELAELKALLVNPPYLVEGLRIAFETTPEFVASVLPPCLTPAAKPSALATTNRYQKFAGGDFNSACVFILAEHEGVEGWYCLTMLLTGEWGTVRGREAWGEPKKMATIELHKDGDLLASYAERHGARLIELDARMERDLGAQSHEFVSYEIKAFPSAVGFGLEYDPLLTIIGSKVRYDTVRAGKGVIRLRGTVHDPLDTIPIVTLGDATHVAGELTVLPTRVVPLPDRDAYLPYVYGRAYDDYTAFDKPLRLRDHQF